VYDAAPNAPAADFQPELAFPSQHALPSPSPGLWTRLKGMSPGSAKGVHGSAGWAGGRGTHARLQRIGAVRSV